jgi:hypothetical protein
MKAENQQYHGPGIILEMLSSPGLPLLSKLLGVKNQRRPDISDFSNRVF